MSESMKKRGLFERTAVYPSGEPKGWTYIWVGAVLIGAFLAVMIPFTLDQPSAVLRFLLMLVRVSAIVAAVAAVLCGPVLLLRRRASAAIYCLGIFAASLAVLTALAPF